MHSVFAVPIYSVKLPERLEYQTDFMVFGFMHFGSCTNRLFPPPGDIMIRRVCWCLYCYYVCVFVCLHVLEPISRRLPGLETQLQWSTLDYRIWHMGN